MVTTKVENSAAQLSNAMNVRNKWSGLFENVKEHGAKGDGVTDDTAAFLKALASGNRIVCPDGTYKIRPGEIILLDGQSIEGGHPRSTTLLLTGTNTQGIITHGAASILNIGIQHIGATPTSGAAIDIQSIDVVVDNVLIRDCYIGIKVNKSLTENLTLIKLTRFYVEYFYKTGLHIENVGDVYLDNFIINAGHTNAGTIGIYLYRTCQAITASNGDVITAETSMQCDAAVNAFPSRPAFNMFSQIYFDSATNGVFLNNCAQMRFTGCWFSSEGTTNGVTLSITDDISFMNCHFVNNTRHGAFVGVGSKRFRFNGCSFICNNRANAGGNGISVSAGCTDFIIQGCTATNQGGGGFTGQQLYGIYIEGTTSDRFIVADNLVTGNLNGGVIDPTTTVNKRVESNY